MRREFIIRVALVMGVIFVSFLTYVNEWNKNGFASVSNGIWQLFLVLTSLLTSISIVEVWMMNRRKQAIVLCILFGFSGMSYMMISPAPHWTLIVMMLTLFYSLSTALLFRGEFKGKV